MNLLEEKNSKYCRTVKALVADGKQKKDDHEACKRVIEEKDKLLKKASADRKLLAKRIEEIENSVTKENASLSDQHKSASYKLKTKTKELEKAQNENKKEVENNRRMQDLFNEKNKRISELEVALATTKSLLDYSKEINLKNRNGREANEVVEKVKEASPIKHKKCKFENTGTCNRKESCKSSTLYQSARGLAGSAPAPRKENARTGIPGVFVMSGEMPGIVQKEMLVGIGILR